MLNEVLRLTKGDLSNITTPPIKKKAMPNAGPLKKVQLSLEQQIKHIPNDAQCADNIKVGC